MSNYNKTHCLYTLVNKLTNVLNLRNIYIVYSYIQQPVKPNLAYNKISTNFKTITILIVDLLDPKH